MKSGNSKSATDDGEFVRYSLSIIQYPLFALVAIYLFLFFATPFEPYRIGDETPPIRLFFFSYLLLPEEYFGAWLGTDAVFSLGNRPAIFFLVLICLLSANGFGNVLLAGHGLKRMLSRLEFHVLSTTLGLGIVSIILFWYYFFVGVSSFESPWAIALPLLISGILGIPLNRFLFRVSYKTDENIDPAPESRSFLKKTTFFALLPIFTLMLLIGGMISSTDYDVLSYHFAGVRDFYEAGRIGFLPHNVYANMPFGAEMFVLWGIALTGDPATGAAVGKTIIASTTVLTSLGVYCFGKRFFSENAGLVGMTLSLTTPWILYVSTAGLVDSVVGMYAFFAIYAMFLRTESPTGDRRTDGIVVFLAGFFAGNAAACKYPAALFVVLPIAAYLAVFELRNSKNRISALIPFAIFLFAVFVACGGWYLKNLYYTGNPVYPLCYSIFGDATGTWNTEVDGRWTRVHAPPDYQAVSFLKDIWRVGMTSPWNAPLTIPFCLMLVFFVPSASVADEKRRIRRTIILLSGWVGFVFLSWWFLTHRIDRFWLPAIPVLSLLGGVGAAWHTDKKAWNRILVGLLAVSSVYCFFVGGAAAPGKNNWYLASPESIRTSPELSTPWAVWFNEHRPEGKVLLVGEAKAFLFDKPVLYSTCWNETPLREIVESGDALESFRKRGVSHVLVDWSEIQRFRSPGNYGFSDFVQPELFERLVAEDILEPFHPGGELAKTSTVVYRVRGFTND